MLAIPIILTPVLLFLSAATLYLFFLAAVYFFHRPNKKHRDRLPELRFAVIIPAHNEAAGISGTLDSLKRIDYPSRLYDIVVVADNCTDNTEEAVVSEGIRCMRREDLSRKGKGYALEYAVRSLIREDYDCFVFIDADSVVSGNFLRIMNSRMLAGHKVVQGCYGISNPDASPLTYLFFIGNTVENKLFYEAKSRLGLPVNLRGNGMCFSRGVLLKNPWDAFSIVEDVEYGLKLIRQGIRIHFEQKAEVLARQPETLRQANIQRVRWASGNMAVSKGYALRLIFGGLLKKDAALVDTGFSLLILSKPLLLLLSVLSAAGSLIYLSAGAGGGHFYAGWSISLLLAQAAYLLTGVFMERLDSRRIVYLLISPLIIMWLFLIAALGLFGYKEGLWLRTRRA
jgi:cellulose synthase/poly-beta-1,6-N-acetylglucosamine synthase-like glycosyltransferase